MRETLQFGLLRGATVAALGLIAGIVAGLISLLTGELFAAATLTSQVFFVLLVIIPAWMVILTNADISDEDAAYYSSVGRALTALVPAALIGSLGAIGLFLAASAQIETIFGGFEGGLLREQILARIGVVTLSALVAISVLVGIGLAFWGNQKADPTTG